MTVQTEEKLEKPCVAEASKEETLKPKDMDRSTSDDDEEDVDGHQHKGISLDDLSDDWVEAQMKDVTVAVIGNVDSGKSTLVGVLTKGGLDDGRGLARAKVFNFSHEAANGRTSSIAQEIMGFSPTGEQVLIDRMGTSTASSRNQTWQQVVSQSERLVTFSDLCGHEKYLKTTIFGLVGQCPDYTMIIVNANAGFQRMSREHLGIALALRIPFFIVITKIDIAPQNVFDENLAQLHKIVKSNAVKRQPLVVTSDDQLEQAASGIYGKQVCPMFCISNVTGEGLPLLRSFLQRLPSRLQDSGLFKPPSSPAEFHIDSIYVVPGVGLVVGGVVRSGRICPGQHLLLGPDKVSQFKPVMVKTIQYKRVTVDMAESGQHCSFALRSLVKRETLKKSMFRKGMVMLGPELQPRAIWSFKAEVVILHHATTIREGYQAMIHCGIIRQCAAVKNMSCELLRSGDKAIVTFRWCYHAEYVCLGETLLFREGRTKGLGFFVGFARLASWSMKSHIMLAQTLCAALALSAMGRRLQQDSEASLSEDWGGPKECNYVTPQEAGDMGYPGMEKLTDESWTAESGDADGKHVLCYAYGPAFWYSKSHCPGMCTSCCSKNKGNEPHSVLNKKLNPSANQNAIMTYELVNKFQDGSSLTFGNFGDFTLRHQDGRWVFEQKGQILDHIYACDTSNAILKFRS